MAVLKVKSSVVLAKALELIKEGYSVYACCAIQLAETDLRFEHHQDIKSNALSIFHRFKPKEVREDLKINIQWWPKGDPARLKALEKAINAALKGND